ncbi:MAG: hypothetical protein KJ906_01340 [Nanoarchaeota archaeon]|nr:hypothetical protein [Nanoarchaeota archaeon]
MNNPLDKYMTSIVLLEYLTMKKEACNKHISTVLGKKYSRIIYKLKNSNEITGYPEFGGGPKIYSITNEGIHNLNKWEEEHKEDSIFLKSLLSKISHE